MQPPGIQPKIVKKAPNNKLKSVIMNQENSNDVLNQKMHCLKYKIHQMQSEILKICCENRVLTEKLEKEIRHRHICPSSIQHSNRPKICRADQKMRLFKDNLLMDNINKIAKGLCFIEKRYQYVKDEQESLELEKEFDSKVFEAKYKKLELKHLQLNQKLFQHKNYENQTI